MYRKNICEGCEKYPCGSESPIGLSNGIYTTTCANRTPRLFADRFIIVEGDNFGGDYPDEKRLNLPLMKLEEAEYLADEINKIHSSDNRPRFWRVEENGYKLQTGFEP